MEKMKKLECFKWIAKEREKVLKELEKRGIYPTNHPTISGSYVTIRCSSPYYDGAQKWFINHPKNDRDWILMFRYVALEHLSECPDPLNCPSLEILKKEEQK